MPILLSGLDGGGAGLRRRELANSHSARASSAALRWAIRSAISSGVSVHRDNGLVLLEQRPRPSNYGPQRGARGRMQCLPQEWGPDRQTMAGQSKSPAGLLLLEHSIRVLLQRANDLCFGARGANFMATRPPACSIARWRQASEQNGGRACPWASSWVWRRLKRRLVSVKHAHARRRVCRPIELARVSNAGGAPAARAITRKS